MTTKNLTSYLSILCILCCFINVRGHGTGEEVEEDNSSLDSRESGADKKAKEASPSLDLMAVRAAIKDIKQDVSNYTYKSDKSLADQKLELMLLEACIENDFEKVQALVNKGIKFSYNPQNNWIHKYLRSNYKKGEETHNGLYYACLNNNAKMAKFLLERNIDDYGDGSRDINEKLTSCYFVPEDTIEVISTLIDHGADAKNPKLIDAWCAVNERNFDENKSFEKLEILKNKGSLDFKHPILLNVLTQNADKKEFERVKRLINLGVVDSSVLGSAVCEASDEDFQFFLEKIPYDAQYEKKLVQSAVHSGHQSHTKIILNKAVQAGNIAKVKDLLLYTGNTFSQEEKDNFVSLAEKFKQGVFNQISGDFPKTSDTADKKNSLAFKAATIGGAIGTIVICYVAYRYWKSKKKITTQTPLAPSPSSSPFLIVGK